MGEEGSLFREIDYKGCKIKLYYDHLDGNPREEFNHLGVMVCWHNRAKLGDKHKFSSPEDFEAWVIEEDKVLYRLPLYIYEHGGITMNVGGFSCPWDSGQVGWIYMTKELARKNWPTYRGSSLKKAVLSCLNSEVREYDCYLIGDIGRWVTLDESGEFIDDACGYYGTKDNENYMIEEGKSSINYHIKKMKEEVELEKKLQSEWTHQL